MHSTNVAKSARLMRVVNCLRDGSQWSTRAIIKQAEVCAVNACIAELRDAGAVITTTIKSERAADGTARRIWYYRMTQMPRGVQ